MTDPESPMVSEYRRWVSELESDLRIAEASLRVTRSGEDTATVLHLRESLSRMRKALSEAEVGRSV